MPPHLDSSELERGWEILEKRRQENPTHRAGLPPRDPPLLIPPSWCAITHMRVSSIQTQPGMELKSQHRNGHLGSNLGSPTGQLCGLSKSSLVGNVGIELFLPRIAVRAK